MMFVINNVYHFFSKYVYVGFVRTKNTENGASSIVRLTPQNIWYIQHCSDKPHPMFEPTPRV